MKTKFEINIDGDALLSFNVLCRAKEYFDKQKFSDFVEDNYENDNCINLGYPDLFYCHLEEKDKIVCFDDFLSMVISKCFIFQENNFYNLCAYLNDKYDYFANDPDFDSCKNFEEFYRKKFISL